jgi:hypothetical protein
MESFDRGFPEEKGCAPLETQPASSLVGTDNAGDKLRAQIAQVAKPERRVLRDDQRLEPLGSPRIIIDRLPWETRVWVDRPVWSLTNPDKTFLGSGSRSAERYAATLFDDLAAKADARVRYRLGRKARNAAGHELARLLDRSEFDR